MCQEQKPIYRDILQKTKQKHINYCFKVKKNNNNSSCEIA